MGNRQRAHCYTGTSRGSMRLTLLLLLLAPALAPAQTEKLHNLFSDAFEAELREAPEMATAVGRNEYNDRWSDWSPAAIERHRARLTALIAELDKTPLAGLAAQDQLSVKVLRYVSTQDLEDQAIQLYLLRVSPLYGFHTAVYITVDRMPARTAADYENIIARLRALPVYVDQNIALLDEGIARGIVQAARGRRSGHPTDRRASRPGREQDRAAGRFSALPAEHSEGGAGEASQPGRRAYQAGLPAGVEENARLHDRDLRAEGPRDHRRLGTSQRPGALPAADPAGHHHQHDAPGDPSLGESEVRRIETEMLAVARETGFTGTLVEFSASSPPRPTSTSATKRRCWPGAATSPRSSSPNCRAFCAQAGIRLRHTPHPGGP